MECYVGYEQLSLRWIVDGLHKHLVSYRIISYYT